MRAKKGARTVAEFTDEMLKTYLEAKVAAIAETPTAEDLERVVKQNVQIIPVRSILFYASHA